MSSPSPRDAAAKEAGLRLLAGLAMLVGATAYVATEVAGHPQALVVVVAGLVGMYVAMNIGANDVANNVGPAFGAKSLTMMGALIIAAIFESAGAFIAGGDDEALVFGARRDGVGGDPDDGKENGREADGGHGLRRQAHRRFESDEFIQVFGESFFIHAVSFLDRL